MNKTDNNEDLQTMCHILINMILHIKNEICIAKECGDESQGLSDILDLVNMHTKRIEKWELNK